MRRFEFYDFKADLLEAQELTKAQEDFAYELQAHCVQMGNRMGKLENVLPVHDLELDDAEYRQALMDCQDLLLSDFQSRGPAEEDMLSESQTSKLSTPERCDEMAAAAGLERASVGWETDGSIESP